MKIEWNSVKSTVRPDDIDYTSSPNTVYLHRNVTESEKDGVVYYDFEEAKLTPSEFAIYSAAKTTETQLTLMEALADIYEKVGEQS